MQFVGAQIRVQRPRVAARKGKCGWEAFVGTDFLTQDKHKLTVHEISLRLGIVSFTRLQYAYRRTYLRQNPTRVVLVCTCVKFVWDRAPPAHYRSGRKVKIEKCGMWIGIDISARLEISRVVLNKDLLQGARVRLSCKGGF